MIATENQLGGILLDLYRGVQNDESWFRALDAIGESLRGSAMFFGTLGPDGSKGMTVRGIETRCGTLLSGPLATPDANPFMGPMMTKPPGKSYLTSAMCGERALLRSQVYEIALRPYGQRHVIGAMLEPAGPTIRTIALTRAAREGDFSDEEGRVLDVLLPHINRAAQLRDGFAQLRDQSTTAFAALERLNRGVIILGADLRIVFANTEARRILSLHEGLRSVGAELVVGNRNAADRLRNGLRAMGRENLLHDPVPTLHLSVPRSSGGLPFALSLTPSPRLMNDGDTRLGSSIVVTIVDPERTCSPSIALLREIYALTPVEAQLAAALCDFDLHDAADELGISINTAKTHLKAVFQKVGVSRQSALVRLVTLHSAS